jgi:outer membrane lipoprotein SlyB
MRITRFASFIAASALLLTGGCYAATSTSRTYGDGGYRDAAEHRARVETIRETIDRQVGDPAGGAVAGALIGGMVTGRAGGAILGALFGAAASQGRAERRFYEVFVIYDEGGRQVFTFQGEPPFRIGDRVVVTDQGIFRD